MKARIDLFLGITLGVSACGGQTIGSSAGDASSDASLEGPAMSMDAGGVGTFEPCPASEPFEGGDCYLTNEVGLVCQYGGTVCTCKNLGQNSAAWTCASSDAGSEAASDAGPLDCTYDDGGATLDASSRFSGSCAGDCPAGTVCAVEIGGVGGGGGEYCAPIMDRCKNDVTCACLASCVCGVSFGRPEGCTDTQPSGTTLDCDNGIR